MISSLRRVDPWLWAILLIALGLRAWGLGYGLPHVYNPDEVSILRAESPYLAALFGGGGHPAAAGARIAGPPLAAQRKVISAIRKELNGKKS